jgi:pSer/pThr/pTyr-binding forkhead associated (FHA) protein
VVESTDIQAEPEAQGCKALASLTLKRGGVETEDVFAFTPPTVIGRFDLAVGPVDVDLGVLDEGRYVSRKHAKITCENGVWKIHDLGSSNGTYVLRDDFERVDEAELQDGSEIAFGNARFTFHLAAPIEEEPAAEVEESS